MSTRFEIMKNGERVCIAGIDGAGVLSIALNYVKHSGKGASHSLHIGGLGIFDGSQNRQHHASWPAPQITAGDEITIRILPPGEFDPPAGMTSSPRKTIDDPEMGTLNYYIHSWDADIAFDAPPITSAHLHLRAGDSGPQPHQRDLLRELRRRHPQLWPEICSALVKCHSDIKSTEELTNRLIPHIGISMDDDRNTLEITYRVEGEPENRAYFVKLRDWVVAEVCAAE
jgi:hypothetical protein